MAFMDQVTGYIAGVSLFLIVVSATNICTDLNDISHIVSESYLDGYSFGRFDNFSLMRCAKACMLRKRCLSFNFNLTSSACFLNRRNSSDVSLTPSATMVYSNIDLWPGRMMAECEGHSCEINERCDVSIAGAAICKISGCLEPPEILNGFINTMGKVVWNFLEIQHYTCESNRVRQGILKCKADGSWATVKCVVED